MVRLKVKKLPSPFPFSSLKHYLSKSKLSVPSIQLSENHQSSICPKKKEISLIKGKQQFSWGTYLPSAFQALNCPSISLSQEPGCIYNIGSVTVTEV